MTVNLRNTSGEPVYLGSAEGRRVDADEVIHVEGELAPKKDQLEDAIVVGTGDSARAYPTSIWTNAGGSAKAEPDVAAPETKVS